MLFSTLLRNVRLSCRFRSKLNPDSFQPADLLYRDFNLSDRNPDGNLDVNTVFNLPDMSCNWGRFSIPTDVLYRDRGSVKNGCLSLAVEHVKKDLFAVPCHDPICAFKNPNYSHVEIREILPDEDPAVEPPKQRRKKKSKRRKALRFAWRTNLALNMTIEFEPTD